MKSKSVNEYLLGKGEWTGESTRKTDSHHRDRWSQTGNGKKVIVLGVYEKPLKKDKKQKIKN